MKRIEINNLSDTECFASKLAEEVKPGDVIALVGQMGAGKTAFSKLFAKALGVEGLVNSPTFTILNVYEDGRIPMYHFDCYRIEDPEEMYAVGFDDYLYGDGVCVIEWADIIKEILPRESLLVKIEVLPSGQRVFEVEDGRKR